MITFLNGVRKPINISVSRKIFYSTSIFIVGVVLGVISKILDETAINQLPLLLETLDLGNFFSGMGIWIFIAVIISLYSKSPIRSAVNVLLFFVGMVGSYYLYTVTIAGFFPKNYMMIWVAMTVISPFMAIVCWYAKGKGRISIFLSAIILLFISRQAFTFGFWYLTNRYILEALLVIFTVLILYQSPKQIIKVVFFGVLLFFLMSPIHLIWGML